MKNVCFEMPQEETVLGENPLLVQEVHVLLNVEGAAGVSVPLGEAMLMFQY